jgi:hypothetical protein
LREVLTTVHAGPIVAQTVVKDIFGRSVNDRFIALVDWQGHVANPAIELTLTPPSDAEFPYRITVRAEGSSRLMLDLPSVNNASGATKQIEFSSPDSIRTIHLTIAPDRVGDQYEVEKYKLSIKGQSESSNEIPIFVLDQDDSLEPSIKTHFDYEHDNIAKLFEREGFREAAEMAIKDWVYFFDYDSFDPVAIGKESISLPGNDWKDHIQVTNQVGYEGFYVFMRSIDSPYSTGFPANNGNYHKQRRFIVPGPMHRSYALILHLYPNAKPFASTSCEDWYLTDPYAVSDIYGLSMHEIGHAFAFHSSWPKHEEYKKKYNKATKVIEYQGYPVPLDPSGHIPGDKKYLDRISGQSGGWSGLFPPRRWLLTKLALLIAAESGLKLRQIGPFLSPEILTQELPSAKSGMSYSTKLKSNFGGVPFYEWTVTDGVLPEGLNFDSFTGKITGTVKAPPGEYPIEIQLRDYDPLRKPVTKKLKLKIH